MARTLTVRLDDETEQALAEREALEPGLATAEVIRDAIGERSSMVYMLRRQDGAVKVGYSAALKVRKAALEVEYGPLELLATMPGGRVEEAALHAKLGNCRQGRTEWFVGGEVRAEADRIVAEWGAPAAKLPIGMVRVGLDDGVVERVLKRVRAKHGQTMRMSDCLELALTDWLVGLGACSAQQTIEDSPTSDPNFDSDPDDGD
jgi:hypothetical protein